MLKFFMQRSPFGRGITLALCKKDEVTGKLFAATDIIFEAKPDYAVIDQVTTLTIEEAQELMDELWHCGIRPTDGAGSAGAMQRAENHIKDLQKITFKLLKIEV